MRSTRKPLLALIFLVQCNSLFSQQPKFEKVLDGAETGIRFISRIVEDKRGIIYISSFSGLYRYDGLTFKHCDIGQKDADAAGVDSLFCLAIDSAGIIWIGTVGRGLKRFDPSSNSTISFQHRSNDPSSLSDNNIYCITIDHLNNIWIGTGNGLDRLDKAGQKFIQYKNDKNDPLSLSGNSINAIYEDAQKVMWIGCGWAFNRGNEMGGLNRLDIQTGRFTHYFNIPGKANSLINSNIVAMLEDSKGNFWVGTALDGLHIMDRQTGLFTRFAFDSAHPENLHIAGSVIKPRTISDAARFVNEDSRGKIWIGYSLYGLNIYDIVTKKGAHFGNILLRLNPTYFLEDTVSGFNENDAASFFRSRDGTIWLGTYEGDLFKVTQPPIEIPYHNLQAGANSFFEENDSIVWIGTSIKGLDRRNIRTGVDTWFTNKNGNAELPPDHDILGLRGDAYSHLWLATYTGLRMVNLKTNVFKTYLHDENNMNSPAGDSVACLHVDRENLWLGMVNQGLDKFNFKTGKFDHYRHHDTDSGSLAANTVNCIREDRNHNMWIATLKGLDKLDQKSNKIFHYLANSEVLSICVDDAGKVWAGTTAGFYFLDTRENLFVEYVSENTSGKIKNVLDILEAGDQKLFLTTVSSIIKIDYRNNAESIYGKSYGVHFNSYYTCDNIKLRNGQLLIGDQNGYYLVSPSGIRSERIISLNFTAFKIGDAEIQDTALNIALWKGQDIQVGHKQNSFSFDFCSTDYANSGLVRYSFKLDHYNTAWHDIGTNHQAYFFDVPPGHYVLKVKATSPDGAWCERSISIVVDPPWWRTWIAYTFYLIAFLAFAFLTNRFIRNRIIEKERDRTRERELAQGKEIEKAYNELKLTQAQLIQSEKMASLGELTAGIAHEIQNPLNFVNNFSEVNRELIEELKTEKLKVKTERNEELETELLNDIEQNLEKINHHGKRADAIVKGMLQHSRASNGVKEPTDINALADEYLRLAYHGLRAKDKEFNATMETDYDSSVGKINIVPQDIGRVILNLVTNAFYAVSERASTSSATATGSAAGVGWDNNPYKPTVSVSTRKTGNRVEIRVSDNGNGIPGPIKDKIFQPFFTTKPTGQGTGLGLSLSYDIVKAHGGELNVEAKEGGGTIFIIQLQA